MDGPETPRYPSPLFDDAEAFASVRGRPAVVYFLADEAIGTPNVREVARAIDDRQFDELDLVIDSLGGDIHAAYQLISYLRRHAKRVNACVPRVARSAATVLCIGADRILLDELAILGPLDAQVYEGTTDSGPKYASALEPFKALERLRDFSLESLQDAAEVLFDAGIHSTDEVLKYALEFVKVTTSPLFDQIESRKLGEFSQALTIGERYGRRLLAQSAPDLPPEKRDESLQRLVHEYPSHEYAIDQSELCELGLRALLAEGEEARALRRLGEHADDRIVAMVEPVDSRLDDEPARNVDASRESLSADLSTRPPEERAAPSPGLSESRAEVAPRSTAFGSQRENPRQPRNPWRRRPARDDTDRSPRGGGPRNGL